MPGAAVFFHQDGAFERSSFNSSCEITKTGISSLKISKMIARIPQIIGHVMFSKAELSIEADGKARSIGISNFEGKYIEELETKWETAPQFIQVEAHPYFTQKDLRVTLDEYGIRLMSWYPLGHGDKTLIEEPIFAELGKKYGKSPAQVILRWHIQMGFVVIPGSKNVEHIRDNLAIMDFALTADEMAKIAMLDKGERYYHRTDEQLIQFAVWKPEFEKA